MSSSKRKLSQKFKSSAKTAQNIESSFNHNENDADAYADADDGANDNQLFGVLQQILSRL